MHLLGLYNYLFSSINSSILHLHCGNNRSIFQPLYSGFFPRHVPHRTGRSGRQTELWNRQRTRKRSSRPIMLQFAVPLYRKRRSAVRLYRRPGTAAWMSGRRNPPPLPDFLSRRSGPGPESCLLYTSVL